MSSSLDFSKQFKQNTCNIQFIKSFHLKYGIYKPREVVNPIKKLVLKHIRFYIGSHISNGMVNKLYIKLISIYLYFQPTVYSSLYEGR